MANISNYKPADYYWMHSKGDYAKAIINGIIVGFLTGFAFTLIDRFFLKLFVNVDSNVLIAIWVICAVVGGVWRFLGMKREDKLAKEANINTAIDVMAKSILDEERK